MRTRRTLVALAAMLAALLLAAGSAAAQSCPKTTLPDVEDEVMCPVCGTPLGQAQRERAFIQELIDQCKSKDEIKDALVREFGPAVLALPEDEGFNVAVYVVPIAVVLLAALGLALTLPRWRRARASAAAAEAAAEPEPALSPSDAKRLDEDLKRYDA
jgi:cytochrome c-type biogenesis protein CcmH